MSTEDSNVTLPPNNWAAICFDLSEILPWALMLRMFADCMVFIKLYSCAQAVSFKHDKLVFQHESFDLPVILPRLCLESATCFPAGQGADADHKF